MTLLLASTAWLLLVGALLVRAITQYRHYEVIRPSAAAAQDAAPLVTVVVPARNEGHNIGRCLDGLMLQDYPRSRLGVVVVDDGSEDGTAEIAQELARADDRVRLIRSTALPDGWLGKPHACWQGAQLAAGEWLCFIDADTTAFPPLIRTAVEIVQSRGLDLLSLQPFQELLTPWERLILPTGFFLIAFTQDLRRTNDAASSEASVNGQFLLIRREAYLRSGGHAAVRGAVGEDSALAGVLKHGGFRIAVLGTEGLLRTRMYTSLRPLWEGTARQAAGLLPHRGALLALAVAALVLAWAPFALGAWGVGALRLGAPLAMAALIASMLGSLALLGTHIGAARYFRIPFWYGFLFPIGYTLGSGVALYGLIQLNRGEVRWKGRTYSTSSTPVQDDATRKRASAPVSGLASAPVSPGGGPK